MSTEVRLLSRQPTCATRFVVSLLAFALACVATPAAAAPGPMDPEDAAIQDVIARANEEQIQALATGDSSVMSDTATAAYFRLLVQTNQALVAGGATQLDLTQLTWGSIQTSGNTAAAIAVETWI